MNKKYGCNQKNSIKDIINSSEHAELINGEVVIENKTSVRHNIAVSEIATSFKNHIKSNNGSCKVFSENVALYVNELCDNDNNFYLPDIMVVCEDVGIKEDGIHTAPKFIAEVTSESTRRHDYNEKLNVYREIGVKEYWIVDLQRNVVYKYLSAEYYIPTTYIYPESMKVSVFEGLMVDMTSFITD